VDVGARTNSDIKYRPNIFEPTWMKCASDSIIVLFRDTLTKLILCPNLEYKELTAEQSAA
jgi:hypothetical protein